MRSGLLCFIESSNVELFIVRIEKEIIFKLSEHLTINCVLIIDWRGIIGRIFSGGFHLFSPLNNDLFDLFFHYFILYFSFYLLYLIKICNLKLYILIKVLYNKFIDQKFFEFYL